MQLAWSMYKNGLKERHFYAYATDEMRIQNWPQEVSDSTEMERIETQESEDGSQSSVDAFAAVMGPDHPGRVRLYGRGVTKTLLKKKMNDSGPSSNVTDKMMQKKCGKWKRGCNKECKKTSMRKRKPWNKILQ
ncbi:hypothetical protein HAX54_030121 [Datura stramonium]|uniref:Uncharacterized protein n=1 Tax=Datura stramonium TaxID=4076 RepID=A0ABS8V770_DATST|nr:hypothetical protein [Datura stramonium]